MLTKRVTTSDVALRAGVSRTTVSFVLNNTPGKTISEETRQKVLQSAADLDYQPHEGARRLAMSRHQSVGLFICHTHSVYTDVYISRLIEGIAQVLNRNRLQLVLQPLRSDQADYLQLARQDNVDGIILLNTHDNDEGLAEIVAADFPLVVIGTLTDSNIPQVDIDNRTAAETAVKHLIGLGHREIAMIVHAPLIYYAAKERKSGFQRALHQAGLNLRPDWIKTGDYSEESGYQAMSVLLAEDARPTAVFAGNDMIAYGAMKAIKDSGLSIPDDISLIGFDDDFLSRYVNPPLTTITVPAPSLGAQAAEMLVRRLNDQKPRENTQRILATHLAQRFSCRSLAG